MMFNLTTYDTDYFAVAISADSELVSKPQPNFRVMFRNSNKSNYRIHYLVIISGKSVVFTKSHQKLNKLNLS